MRRAAWILTNCREQFVQPVTLMSNRAGSHPARAAFLGAHSGSWPSKDIQLDIRYYRGAPIPPLDHLVTAPLSPSVLFGRLSSDHPCPPPPSVIPQCLHSGMYTRSLLQASMCACVYVVRPKVSRVKLAPSCTPSATRDYFVGVAMGIGVLWKAAPVP